MRRAKYQQKLIFNYLLMASLLSLVLLLSGCNNSSNETSSDGDLYISLTDAEGDFSAYTVDVTSISLLKANGTEVETLPTTARVDFAQYVDMTEFLTAIAIPSGLYVKGTLTVDYSNADIWVEDSTGQLVQINPENLLDEDGNVVTTMDLSVRLEDHNSLLIVPGLPSHLTLDFDLSASHQSDFTSDEPVVTVKPVLIADVDLEENKSHRVRGPMQSVDLTDSSYQVHIRPFHKKVSNSNAEHFGRLTVKTTAETLFQIDGEMYKGEAGLQALTLKERYTATIAIGDIKSDPRRFEATEVYAGNSVPGGNQDVVKGSVIARSGDTLTVRGATLIRSSGSVDFKREVIVNLGQNTKVKKQLSMDEQDISVISVGSKVTIFGELLQSIPDVVALDATQGFVNLELTNVGGTVVDNSSGIVMDLKVIDRFRIAAFDFAGTGTAADSDADPSHYELDTTTLDVSQLSLDERLIARGFVSPFGSAPADFEATTLISQKSLPAIMVVDWDPASTGAISQLDSAGMVLNLSGTGRFHHVSQGGNRIDLASLSSMPTILPGKAGWSHYIINEGDAHHLYLDFDVFVTELNKKLNSGAAVKRVQAPGLYNNSDGTLTARRINVHLQLPAATQ